MPRKKKQQTEGIYDRFEDPKPKRVCTDCGKPTNDYRCPACWRKRRLKEGLRIGYEGDYSDETFSLRLPY